MDKTPFAVGKGGDQRRVGDKGEDGDITLLCKTIENKHGNSVPVSITKGAVGQNGEMGGLKAVTPDKKYPLSWSDIEKLYKLLSEFDLKSEYDNSGASEFKVKELKFEVDYEVLR